MRSLWRVMAARWLGGEASDALTGDATLLDLLMPRDSLGALTYVVRRQSEVSHRAMMLQQERAKRERQTQLIEFPPCDRHT
jgi:hypothetical protein